VPADVADLGPRDAVDQVLHRLVRACTLRRITRGRYDKPNLNALTGKSTHPDPRSVIDALARRDSAQMIVDGISAANDIGLSDAVPAHIIVYTDARLKSLALRNLIIDFKKLPSANCSGPDDLPYGWYRRYTGCVIH
jgi:predicted transcriptional regulator of viral defense system